MGYQARERQKVTRRRMDVRNRSGMLYLALAKETSLFRLSLSSLGRGRGGLPLVTAGRQEEERMVQAWCLERSLLSVRWEAGF